MLTVRVQDNIFFGYVNIQTLTPLSAKQLINWRLTPIAVPSIVGESFVHFQYVCIGGEGFVHKVLSPADFCNTETNSLDSAAETHAEFTKQSTFATEATLCTKLEGSFSTCTVHLKRLDKPLKQRKNDLPASTLIGQAAIFDFVVTYFQALRLSLTKRGRRPSK